ncbi:DUF3488 and transglutaminase-like domain-containing protein [Aquincola sp. MAHUQ-54]|uniref:DUF3488 and transglutaminase-like domain-containing protein n=1 Tax=Aquincola agrisoli TaxID=3119538 RepID=A0AAW9QL25_9BURK
MTTARPRSAPRWPALGHLPRDARDVLFLLAVIGWTILPHLPHVPLWCGLLAAAVLAGRALLAVRSAPLPSRWLLAALLALAIGLTLNSHRTLLGKEAGVTLLVVLMVLKTLELRARRDALVVFFLGFFLVLTNFLYSQSLPVAAAMIVSVWGLLTALVLAHMPVGQPALREAGRLAARTTLLGVPVMVLLFLLFPRMGPLWALPQDAAGRTGLSGTLTLGGVAEVANDESIAFRVRFRGPVPDTSRLYWRGPVLSSFDGREWHRLRRGMFGGGPPAELRTRGAPVAYEMTLEPSRLPLLPLLEATPAGSAGAPVIDGWRTLQRHDLEWTTERPVMDRLRFTAQAWPDFEHGPREAVISLQDHLSLPAGYNPRTLAWAAALRNDPRYLRADAATLTGAVLQHIRAGGYTYTLAPGVYGDDSGRHAIDEFWLDRKLGFCEHFATAFVVVMRALDVPARVVTGYQGADPVLQDGYVVVRQSYAHAWAEVWQAGRGWVRVDPTAAVAPDRVDRSQPLRPPPGLVAGALAGMSPALMAQWRNAWELVNNRWNQWVLNYSRAQQFDLLQRLGVQAPRWEDLALLLVVLASTAALAGAAWALWDRQRRDPWERLQARVRQRLAALGVRAAPHEGPRTLAGRVRQQLGARGEPVAAAMEALDALRYGRDAARRPSPAWWRAFTRAAAAAQRPG